MAHSTGTPPTPPRTCSVMSGYHQRDSVSSRCRPKNLYEILARSSHSTSRPFSALSQARLFTSSHHLSIGSVPLRPSADPVSNRHDRPYRRKYSTYIPPNAGPMQAFWLLFALNTIPFIAWNYARTANQPRLQAWLQKNFVFSRSSATSKPWTWLTSGFSHVDLLHFGFNMFTLNTCCTILAASTGLGMLPVVGLQLAGVLGGNLASYAFMEYDRRQGLQQRDRRRVMMTDMKYHLGASGGVSACLVAASCYSPMMPINIMFIPIGIPLALFTGLYMLFDAGRIGNPLSKIGHEAHVGGGITGGLFYLLLSRIL